MRGLPAGTPWAVVAGVTGYVVVAAAALLALVDSGTDPYAVGVLALAAVVLLVLTLARLLGTRASTARRLAVDTTVMVDANPGHRLEAHSAGDLTPLAEAVNRLADEREAAQRDATERAAAARRDVESERNRLAALMAQLRVAVLVCNSEGRILLYNAEARALLGAETPVGLGRSVFGVVDRGLVTHALARLETGAEAYTASTVHGDRLLRVRVTLVREGGVAATSGFVLVLEDLTRPVRAGDRREHLLRQLTRETRASLGSIRAAAESVLEFPEATGAERDRFLEIVRDEADQLGRRVGELTELSTLPDDDRLLTDITGDDLVQVVRTELESVGVRSTTARADRLQWVRVDAHAVARSIAHLAARLREGYGAQQMSLSLTAEQRHGRLDARWEGQPPAASQVEAWLDEPLEDGGTTTLRQIAERHGAEVWCGEHPDGTAYLRMLLPLADLDQHGGRDGDTGHARATGPVEETPAPIDVPSRPEFYDFDLFTSGPRPADLTSQRLDEMSFTVLDTETTGLDPVGGDRIISVGAVRVVNGRVLRQETFERLVDPRRPVPAESTAIHGITADMLEGQPTARAVLPELARFAEDTVLVGHNVAFDLQFLQLADSDVVLTQPALDTLLLHAALHPDHQEHTLEAIAGRLGVSVVGRHTALGDALVTAEVLVGLLPLLRRNGVETLGEAMAAAQRTYQARMSENLYGGRPQGDPAAG